MVEVTCPYCGTIHSVDKAMEILTLPTKLIVYCTCCSKEFEVVELNDISRTE